MARINEERTSLLSRLACVGCWRNAGHLLTSKLSGRSGGRSLIAVLKTRPAMEAVYRDLFVRDILKLGLEDCYYPVSAAANHSLLYLITRSFLELPIKNVLELGAGQSSILISRLSSKPNKAESIRTVEHDQTWAADIQSKVGHPVHVAPLQAKTVSGNRIRHYSGRYFDPSVLYDFVLIDGPPASSPKTAMNRIGAIDLVDANLAQDFVLIVDDTERRGEATLTKMIRETLRGKHKDFGESAVVAAKRQHVFASGAYLGAAYF
jgi:hypothetical protein